MEARVIYRAIHGADRSENGGIYIWMDALAPHPDGGESLLNHLAFFLSPEDARDLIAKMEKALKPWVPE